MKIIKFPGTKYKSHDAINTTKIHRNQKSPLSKSPKLLAQFKKSGSLDITYYRQKKNDQLQKIYRFSSYDKKYRNKSTSSTKSTNQLKYYMKNTAQRGQFPKKQLLYPEKKIFLKTQKKSRYYFNDLKATLQVMCERLQKCLQAKSQKLFIEQYNQALMISSLYDQKQNGDHVLNNFIMFFRKCQQKKNDNKIQVLNSKLNLVQKQKLGLNVEMRKNKIKQQTLNLQINKLTDKNLELIKQLKKFKQKIYQNQFSQTSDDYMLESCGNSMDGLSSQFPKLIKQLRVLKQKQNNMNILIEQLQKEGINLQKVFKRAVKRIQNQNNQKLQQNSSSCQQIYQSQQPKGDKQSKKSSKIKQKITNKNQSFADDSIIDQIQALSFTYQQKETPIQMFKPKQVYVCQKVMDVNLKQKLKLDFGCLYQQPQQSYNSPAYSSQGFQTI